jgi:hypothetical protein
MPRTSSEKRRRRVPTRFSARGADRFDLYQLAVQAPREDTAFLARVYRAARGRGARHMREDFCGTALLCAAWVRRDPRATAEGFDIDPVPLSWGAAHNFAPLGRAAARATLHLKDVRSPSLVRPDVRCAQNFSWWTLKTRAELVDYFRRVLEDLDDEGVFVLDLFGGPDALNELQETRSIGGRFTYVWEQVAWVPGTGEYRADIHFRFRDGSRMDRAFRYHWRLWTLSEARDALLEAGFRAVEQYWEGTNASGTGGNGVWRRSRGGQNCLCWVTYLVGLR